jgi:hypothetical protein
MIEIEVDNETVDSVIEVAELIEAIRNDYQEVSEN